MHNAALADKGAKHIHFVTISLRRRLNLARGLQSVALPIQAAPEGPIQNAGEFRFQLIGEVEVFAAFKTHLEGH